MSRVWRALLAALPAPVPGPPGGTPTGAALDVLEGSATTTDVAEGETLWRVHRFAAGSHEVRLSGDATVHFALAGGGGSGGVGLVMEGHGGGGAGGFVSGSAALSDGATIAIGVGAGAVARDGTTELIALGRQTMHGAKGGQTQLSGAITAMAEGGGRGGASAAPIDRGGVGGCGGGSGGSDAGTDNATMGGRGGGGLGHGGGGGGMGGDGEAGGDVASAPDASRGGLGVSLAGLVPGEDTGVCAGGCGTNRTAPGGIVDAGHGGGFSTSVTGDHAGGAVDRAAGSGLTPGSGGGAAEISTAAAQSPVPVSGAGADGAAWLWVAIET